MMYQSYRGIDIAPGIVKKLLVVTAKFNLEWAHCIIAGGAESEFHSNGEGKPT
jgi:hypothetical protein